MIARGQAAGAFRADADPVEVHMAIAALGMFNVTNQYTFGAIFQRDMPVLQGVILVLSTMFVVLYLAVDVVQGLIDPRIVRN